MDNASFYRVDVLREIAKAYKVRLEMLPPYLLDFNPIEELFSDIKKSLKKH
jgi:transposase